jgi:CDP-diacylglycerol--glycerol-3-phosphate 3-phosphatidyltransferase
MTLPMILTVGRIVLAPIFFILYYLAGIGSPFLLIPVWLVFGLIEVSDLLDGHFARTLSQVSEMGKVLDPFADSLSRLTYFFCFVSSGFLPIWILLVLVYRDIAVSYVRIIMSGRGVMLAARLSGKVKALVYGVAGGVGIAVFSLHKLGWAESFWAPIETAAFIVFFVTVLAAAWTLMDYLRFLRKEIKKAS